MTADSKRRGSATSRPGQPASPLPATLGGTAAALQSLLPGPDHFLTGAAVTKSRAERAANLQQRLASAVGGGKAPDFSQAFKFPPGERAKALTTINLPQASSTYAEAWLNICLEDGMEGAEAAKRFKMNPDCFCGLAMRSISRKDLAEAGMNSLAIDSVYRGLYVYSTGFGDTMSSLLAASGQQYGLLNRVWEAFLHLAQTAMQVGGREAGKGAGGNGALPCCCCPCCYFRLASIQHRVCRTTIHCRHFYRRF